MTRYGDGLSSDVISAWGRTITCLQHQAGPLGVLKASFWLKNGHCYFSKNDELSIEWANRYTLFCCIVIHTRSLADHNTKLQKVLDRLRMYRLKLQPEKCEYT
jgi:hypothetical protein